MDEETENSACELAKILAQKICRKSNLPQIFLSFNVADNQAVALKNDFKSLTQLQT